MKFSIGYRAARQRLVFCVTCGMEKIGKAIVVAGLLMVVAGVVVWLMGDRLRFLGRLPGDFRYESENTRIYFPFMTMLLVSVLLSLLMWLFQKLR